MTSTDEEGAAMLGGSDGWITVSGCRLRTDVGYDTASHMWVSAAVGDTMPRTGQPDMDGLAALLNARSVRIGFDPLGLEINGTLAQLALDAPGERRGRGETLGSLEAEKFVGPVVAPISGIVEAVNEAVCANPARVSASPFDSWVVQVRPDPATWRAEVAGLVQGEAAVGEWFADAVRRYRLQGVLAE